MRLPRHLLAFAALALAMEKPLLAAPEQPAILFEDAFQYSGWARGADPMRSTWTKVTGREPEFLIPDGESEPSAVKLGNNIFYVQPDKPLSGSFTISAEALFTSYSRSLWIGLLREDATAGRAAVWGAALESQYSGQGWAQIRAVESDPAIHPEAGWDVNTFSVALQAKPIISGHSSGAITPPFAKIDLHWDADASRWTLYVDGRQVAGAADEFDFGPSPRLYFGGGTGVLFKKITLTAGGLPE